MRYPLAPLPMLLLTGASGASPPVAATIESIGKQTAANGLVLAQLNDWRAMLFGSWILIAVLVALLVWIVSSSNRREEQAEARRGEERAMLAAALTKMADATDALAIEVKVLRAVASRVDSSNAGA